MPQVEDVFRTDLLALALASQWPDWDACRLVFADWLEERSFPEAAFARASWRCVWIKKDRSRDGLPPWVYLFEAPVVELPAKGSGGSGQHNARPLLGFHPGSLKLLRYVCRGQAGPAVQLSWCPGRRLRAQMRTDRHGKLWLHGFPDLWLERVVPGGQKLLFA